MTQVKDLNTQISILKSSQKTQKENPKDEAIGDGHYTSGRRDCKKLRLAVYELRLTQSEIVHPQSEIK
jgi:hypothetical protein